MGRVSLLLFSIFTIISIQASFRPKRSIYDVLPKTTEDVKTVHIHSTEKERNKKLKNFRRIMKEKIRKIVNTMFMKNTGTREQKLFLKDKGEVVKFRFRSRGSFLESWNRVI